MAKMSVLIITQARIGSTRLPNKILKPLNDETILSLHIKRLKKVHYFFSKVRKSGLPKLDSNQRPGG